MGDTVSVMFEEIIVDIDFAGRLQGDSMVPVADPQSFVPIGMNSIEEAAVSAQSNGDALGSEGAVMIISGGGILNGGIQEIAIGASGGEDVDIIHSGVTATVLRDLGIAVKPGGEYQVFFQMTGEDGGELICAAELVFNTDGPREPKQWVCREAQNVGIANVQGANLGGVDATVAPGDSRKIGGIIGATSSDGGALGGSNQCCILSNGCYRQEYNIGGFGGELITGEGDTMPPTQRIVSVPLNGSHIMVEFRMTGEDSGTTSSLISIGLVVS